MHFSQEQRTLESTYETPVTNYLKVNTSDPESVDTRCTGRNRSSSPASISERFAALHSQQPASSGSVALMGAKGKTSKWALSICVGSCDRSVLSSLTTLLLVQRIVFDSTFACSWSKVKVNKRTNTTFDECFVARVPTPLCESTYVCYIYMWITSTCGCTLRVRKDARYVCARMYVTCHVWTHVVYSVGRTLRVRRDVRYVPCINIRHVRYST